MLNNLLQQQKNHFLEGATLDIQKRKSHLLLLKRILQENEEKLYLAISQDFGKSSFETFMTEFSFIYHEINLALKNLKNWSRPKKVRTGLSNWPGKSFIVPAPFGVSLVIGAWNYPYQLTLVPAISALAAGNTVILKPSELASHSAQALKDLINVHFADFVFHVVTGDAYVSQELLKLKFDKIFFTGSTSVGKIVAKAAAENLTSVTLELGGKSPCLVCADSDLEMAAKRIVWGKFLNAGQTCIAPDYLLIEEPIYESFLQELKKQVILQFGSDSSRFNTSVLDQEANENYVRIINKKHTERLQNLLPKDRIYYGGQVDVTNNYFSPTILRDVSFDDIVMQEEIFGPILPTMAIKNDTFAVQKIQEGSRPLALYIFTKNIKKAFQFMEKISFGGGAINDVVMHIGNSNLPFGGVGESGMGSYHGEFGFKAFSHYKAVLQKSFLFEPSIKYRPYSNWKAFIIKLIQS